MFTIVFIFCALQMFICCLNKSWLQTYFIEYTCFLLLFFLFLTFFFWQLPVKCYKAVCHDIPTNKEKKENWETYHMSRRMCSFVSVISTIYSWHSTLDNHSYLEIQPSVRERGKGGKHNGKENKLADYFICQTQTNLHTNAWL